MTPNTPLGSLQQRIVAILAPGEWITGSVIAAHLDVNRGSIVNAIRGLRRRGLEIMADGRGQASLGYLLAPGQDLSAYMPVPAEYEDWFRSFTTGDDPVPQNEARVIIHEHIAVMARRSRHDITLSDEISTTSSSTGGRAA